MHSFPLCPFSFFAKDIQLAIALPVVHVTAIYVKMINFCDIEKIDLKSFRGNESKLYF